jgi:hypothetical protein
MDSDCTELLVVDESSLGCTGCADLLRSDRDRKGFCRFGGGLVAGLRTDEGDDKNLRDACVPKKCQLSSSSQSLIAYGT